MAELTDAQKVLRNDTGKRIAEAIEALGGTSPIGLGMTGATPGQVPVINTVDANGVPTSYRPGAGGGGGTPDYNPYFRNFRKANITCNGDATVIVDIPIGDVPSGWAATAVTSWVDNTGTTGAVNLYKIFMLNEWSHVMVTGTEKTMHFMYSNVSPNNTKFTANVLVMYTRI